MTHGAQRLGRTCRSGATTSGAAPRCSPTSCGVAGGLDRGGAGQFDRGGQRRRDGGNGPGGCGGVGHAAIVPDARRADAVDEPAPAHHVARVRHHGRRARLPPTARCAGGCARAGRSGPVRADRVDTTPLGVPAAGGPTDTTAGWCRRRTSSRTDVVPELPPTGARPAEGDRDPGGGGPVPAQLTAAAAARVRAASRADGAGESGLTQLLWVNALHMAGDAMIAVSLAGTLFFAAATGAQRGNVALYLLVTMAPFARAGAGHRPGAGPAAARPALGAWRAASLGRAVLALVMAAPLRRPLALPGRARRPGAVEGAQRAARRGGPARAARRHVADLGQRPAVGVRAGHGRRRRARVGAGHRRGRSASTGSCGATAVVFLVAGVLAVRLPRARRRPHRRTAGRRAAPPPRSRSGRRDGGAGQPARGDWRCARTRRCAGSAASSPSSPRSWSQATFPGGWEATARAGRARRGRRGGQLRRAPAAGSRLHAAEPDRLVLVSAGAAAGDHRAGRGLLQLRDGRAWSPVVSAVTNALGKVSLDAIIQREVPESLRASAFARSETLLQLAWVVGGALRHRAAADRLARLHRGRGAAGRSPSG